MAFEVGNRERRAQGERNMKFGFVTNFGFPSTPKSGFGLTLQPKVMYH
jgi:hypothetical protein